MDTESLAEFKKFEEVQNKLIKVLLEDGYIQKESEEIGFFIAQGIRDVPTLLGLLDEVEAHSTDEIMNAIYNVLLNRSALEEAYKLLSSLKTR
jgi:hypothetical protein